MLTTAERSVLFVVFDGMSLFNLSGPIAAFHAASDLLKAQHMPGYDSHVVSIDGGAVTCEQGVTLLSAPVTDFSTATVDTIVVPGGWPSAISACADRRLITWIAEQGRTARRVCSVCSGAFLLAEAGLLDGKRAVTHWMVCDVLKERYPTVAVESDPIFVRDDPIWTSAGAAAGIDLALALIQADHGRDLAMQVARIGVVFLKRPGGQSQFSTLLKAQSADTDMFGDLHEWLMQHASDPELTVEVLADRAGMSPRNFARVYKARIGRTPAKTIELFRVEAARRLLEDTDERIDAVARRAGFGDEERMRITFQRHLNVSPRDYRERFSNREPA